VVSSALVLAGGGEVAMAWESGILTGLRRQGIDLGDADAIVGTSAGAVVGTALASGHDPGKTLRPPTTSPAERPTDLDALMAAIAPTFDESLDPTEARRLVGQHALAADARGEQALIDLFVARLPTLDWPTQRLLITAVDATTGEFVVWDRDSKVPFLRAIAASYAVPSVTVPIEVNGRRYMDGGMRSTTNADLAGAATAVVVLHPLAHLLDDTLLQAEIATLDRANVVVVSADDAAAAVFGVDVLDPGRWEPAFRAGLDQVAAVADQVRAVWTTGR
jgi:NTE family protein